MNIYFCPLCDKKKKNEKKNSKRLQDSNLGARECEKISADIFFCFILAVIRSFLIDCISLMLLSTEEKTFELCLLLRGTGEQPDSG